MIFIRNWNDIDHSPAAGLRQVELFISLKEIEGKGNSKIYLESEAIRKILAG